MQEINATKRTDIYQIDPRNVDVVAGFNVRREFAIDELKEQIKLNGVLNPITVIPTKLPDGTERYRLVDGERRLRATLAAIAEGADIRRIKAIFLPRNTSEEEQLVQQMMRNEGKNFTEYECAIMFHRFKEAFGYSQTEIAAKFGKSTTFVSRCLSLMELAPEIQQRLESGEISTNAVREIVGQNKDNEAAQVEAVNAAVSQAKASGKRTADNNDVPTHVKLLKAIKKASLAFKQAMALQEELKDDVVLDLVCCRAAIEAVAAQTDYVLGQIEGYNKALQDEGNK
nr:MAG TPA: chromosome partitioning protein [Caudoviricetes sp.]